MADRDERLNYAQRLIIGNPDWGKDKVNKAVKARFGEGLRRIDVARLKDQLLLGRPKARTGRKPVEKLVKELILEPEKAQRRVITIGFDEGYHRLRSAGFIDMEIRNFFSAGNVPELFNTNPFKAMLRTRREYLRKMSRRGWTKAMILMEIKRYYTKPERSPFDYLRREYGNTRKVTVPKYRQAARKRAKAETAALYGGRR